MTEWRTVPEWPSYEVSSLGAVRSRSRTHGLRVYPGKTLRQRCDRDGYCRVNLSEGARRRTARVHQLVAEAFFGPPPTIAHVVAHWDGNRANNRIANLRWATNAENLDDARRHGSVLSAAQVAGVREALQRGERQRAIARQLGVCPQTISNIANGHTWAHDELAGAPARGTLIAHAEP